MVCIGLEWNGAMKNVMLQVVNTDRTRMNDILNAFEPVIKKLKQFFTQVGRISTFKIYLQEATVTPDDYVWQEINFNLNGYQANVEQSDEENTVQTGNETLYFNSNTTTPSSCYQNSVDVQDFTVERCKDDSTHD